MALTRWTRRNDLWDPFANLADIQNEMNRMFDTSTRRLGATAAGFLAPTDVLEEGDTLVVRVDLPGLRKEDVHVSLQENQLTIRGERKADTVKDDAPYFHRERMFGSFSRMIELPYLVNAGKIEAQFRDGVLQITLPKAEEAKPKQIEVKVG